MSRLHKVILAMLVGVLLVSASVSAAENLIANPSFEQGEAEGLPVGYKPFQNLVSYGHGAQLVKGIARTGDWSLSFSDPTTVALGLISEPVPAEAGKTYKASGYVLTEPGSGRASFYLEFLDADKKRVSATWVQAQPLDGWELLELTEVAPEKTAYVNVIIYRMSKTKGVQYFDDISIVTVP